MSVLSAHQLISHRDNYNYINVWKFKGILLTLNNFQIVQGYLHQKFIFIRVQC